MISLRLLLPPAAAALLLLSACGGGSPDYTVGGTVSGLAAGGSLVLGDKDGSSVRVDGNQRFSMPTPRAGQTSYAVTVTTQPQGQHCIVEHGEGQAGPESADAIRVTCRTAHAYVLNARYAELGNMSMLLQTQILHYTIGQGGQLVAAPSAPVTLAGGSSDRLIAVDQSGSHAYILDRTARTISQHVIEPDGALTAKPAVTLPAGTSPSAIAVTRDGKHVYVTDLDAILQYHVDSNGLLVRATPVSVAAQGRTASQLAIDPAGRHAYAANADDGTISHYIVGADGLLTAAGTTPPAGQRLGSITLTPDGRSIVTWSDKGTVLRYSVNPDGSLVRAPDTNLAISDGRRVIPGPDGRTLYIPTTDRILQYAVAGDWSLQPLGSLLVLDSQGPRFDAAGRYAYVGGIDGRVRQYAVESNGILTPLAVPSVAVPGQGNAVLLFYR